MTQARDFLRQNWLLICLFGASFLLALWFAIHAALHALYFNDPRNVDDALKPWMTPRYVVMTYDLPRPFVMEVLALDPEADQGIRLGQIAKERGVSLEELTEVVRRAANGHREDTK